MSIKSLPKESGRRLSGDLELLQVELILRQDDDSLVDPFFEFLDGLLLFLLEKVVYDRIDENIHTAAVSGTGDLPLNASEDLVAKCLFGLEKSLPSQ